MKKEENNNIIKNDFKASYCKRYKIKAIQNSIVYTRKSKINYLLEFYHLIF